jgi:hypothetical protein
LKKLLYHLAAILLSLTAHGLAMFSFGFTHGDEQLGDPAHVMQATILPDVTTVPQAGNLLPLNPIPTPSNAGMNFNSPLAFSLPVAGEVDTVSSIDGKTDFLNLSRAAHHYFSASELTRKPIVEYDSTAELMLNVPLSDERVAILNLFIDENGEVDFVGVNASLLPRDAKDILLNAFTQLKFTPGEIDGMPVKSQLRIEVNLEEMQPLHQPLL